MGVTLGPALGPIIGGLLGERLGWRSIFWFLTIYSAVLLLIIVVFLPETGRSVVGNGSIPPKKWNVCLFDMIRGKKWDAVPEQDRTLAPRRRLLNPLDVFRVISDKETGIILLFCSIVFAGLSAVLSSLPSQLQEKYQFNALQVGLCYIPYGVGSMSTRFTFGVLLDWNFRRHAKLRGIEIVKNRQQRLADFPIEYARLQVTIPVIYVSSMFIIIYSWVMEFRTNLAGPLVALYFYGASSSGTFSSLSTLLVDCQVESPATAFGALNLCRCLLGAGSVAIIVPLINRIGFGWAGTLVAGIMIIFSPLLWCVMIWGHGWRNEKRRKLEEKKKAKKANLAKS